MKDVSMPYLMLGASLGILIFSPTASAGFAIAAGLFAIANSLKMSAFMCNAQNASPRCGSTSNTEKKNSSEQF